MSDAPDVHPQRRVLVLRVIPLIGAFVALMLAFGCQRISTTRIPAAIRDPAAVWEKPISPTARAGLAFRRLRLAFVAHPREVYRTLECETLAHPSPDDLLMLGELAYRIGQRSSAIEATGWFRDAAAYGVFALNDPGLSPGQTCEAVELHNRAVAQCIRKTRIDHERRPDPGCLAASGIVLATHEPDLDPNLFDRLEVAGDFAVTGMPTHRVEGLGVPLLAVREMPDRAVRSGPERFYGRKFIPTITAVMLPGGSPAGGQWRTQASRLVIFDPIANAGVPIGARTLPLAADFTTPLAAQSEAMRTSPLEIAGVVNADRLAELAGIYQIHPYRPGKIPVLFIHGLASSPQAWVPMFNALRADPRLRERYQFWFAYYPTGYPLPVSVAKLRGELHALRRAIDPQGADPALNNMVVVGHSLGGLVSRMLIQSSGDRVWNAFFTRPPGAVAIPPQAREQVQSIFFFEPEPSIRRAVFIAAPHRGSVVANQVFGRFSAALVRPSQRIAELRQGLVALNGPDILRPEYRDRMLSSIDNLEWDSPVLKTLAALPMAPGVPYHSIVGNVTPFADPSRWGDTIVSYTSAHLDGAASELIVPHVHTRTNTRREGIDEVHRILLLHLDETGPQPVFPPAQGAPN